MMPQTKFSEQTEKEILQSMEEFFALGLPDTGCKTIIHSLIKYKGRSSREFIEALVVALLQMEIAVAKCESCSAELKRLVNS